MGKTLLQFSPRVARRTIRELDSHLAQLTPKPSWTIEALIAQPEESSIVNDAEYAQPLCTAIQILLVDLLSHWGVKPLATVGHSSGT